MAIEKKEKTVRDKNRVTYSASYQNIRAVGRWVKNVHLFFLKLNPTFGMWARKSRKMPFTANNLSAEACVIIKADLNCHKTVLSKLLFLRVKVVLFCFVFWLPPFPFFFFFYCQISAPAAAFLGNTDIQWRAGGIPRAKEMDPKSASPRRGRPQQPTSWRCLGSQPEPHRTGSSTLQWQPEWPRATILILSSKFSLRRSHF